MSSRLARAKRTFFQSFFRLLVLVIGVAEWACVVRVLDRAGVVVPSLLHLLMPVLFYGLNRGIIACRSVGFFRGRPWLGVAARSYSAVALSSVFGGVLLLLAALLRPAIAFVAEMIDAPSAVAAGALSFVPGATGLPRAFELAVDLGVGGMFCLLLYGYTFGQRRLRMPRFAIDVPDLPADLEGLRIVHISDLHIGEHMGLRELSEHVERINALNPDLVCVTGDLVDRPESCAPAFPVLGKLRARHGVYVTLGNHDFYAGSEVVTEALRQLTPHTVLRDAEAVVSVGQSTLRLLGVDDLGLDWARGVSEHPALERLAGGGLGPEVTVVLSHRPDCFPQAARLGAALMLSGHTHGGQLGLPGFRGSSRLNLARFITDFDRGLYSDGDARLYVSCGLGFTAQRVRISALREIAVLELRRSARAGGAAPSTRR